MTTILTKWIQSAKRSIHYRKRIERKINHLETLTVESQRILLEKLAALSDENRALLSEKEQLEKKLAHLQTFSLESHHELLNKMGEMSDVGHELLCENKNLSQKITHLDVQLANLDMNNHAIRQKLWQLLLLNQHCLPQRQEKAKKHVLFMIHNMKTWSALSLIYQNMSQRDDVRVFVLAIQSEANAHQQSYSSETMDFLNKEGIGYFSLNHNDVDRYLAYMYAINPDFVIRQSPWDNDIPDLYSSLNVAHYRLIYIPYFSLDLIDDFSFNQTNLVVNQNFHLVCHKIYCLSQVYWEKAKRTFIGNPDILKFLGNTKLEYLHKKFPLLPKHHFKDRGCLNILWAPHHSINSEWLAFGTFEKNCLYIIELLKKYGNQIHIKYRPHPLLDNSMRLKFPELLQNFNEEWAKLPNASVDTSWDYLESFAWSDMLLTDGVSFIAEYPLTYQPVVFIENESHMKFNDNGNLAYDCCYVAKENEQIEQYIIQFMNNDLPIKTKQLEKYKQTLLIDDVAEKIVNDILDK